MDGGAWKAAVHGVLKSLTRLSDFTFTFHFHALEKEMATHSSILAWRIPGMGEPVGLPSMGSHRVGHDWSDLAVAVAVAASKNRVSLVVRMGFLGGSVGKELPAIWKTWVWSPGWEDPLGGTGQGGQGNPFQILAWRIPMDRGAWRTTVHGFAKNPAGLSDSLSLV